MLHIFISGRPGRTRAGTTGEIVAGYEAKIVDDDGAPVPDGTPGNLYVRGRSAATGYWCRMETTRLVFQGHWVRTGDTYVRSSDGYYSSLGRTDDIIKAGGIWVSPTEVEERLRQHPAVMQAVVVSVPDDAGLDKPVACTVLAAGLGGDGRGPGRLLPGGPGRLQAPPQRPRLRRAADHRDRQAAAFPRPRTRPRAPRRRGGARPDADHRRTRMTATDTLLPPGPAGSGRDVDVDLLVVGAGPAGLYAAYYAGFRGLRTARRGLPARARRPGHGAVPGEDDLRRRGLPRHQGPRPGRRAGGAGRALRPGLPAGRARRAPQTRPGTARGRASGSSSPPTRAPGSGAAAVVITGGIGTFTPRPLPGGSEWEGRGLTYFVKELAAHAGQDVVIVGGGDSAVRLGAGPRRPSPPRSPSCTAASTSARTRPASPTGEGLDGRSSPTPRSTRSTGDEPAAHRRTSSTRTAR